jgi:hypothetical protein
MPFFVYYRDVYFGLGEQPAGWTGPSWPDLQFGHLWFVQHLLVFALWESVFCCGMCIGLLVLFRERVNVQNRWSRALAAAAEPPLEQTGDWRFLW